MSGHVGDRVSALVDGELDHEERDQALAHAACCAPCKQALEAERQVRDLVGSLGDQERTPAPSADMLAGLLRLGADSDSGGPLGAESVPPGRRPGRTQPAGAAMAGRSRRPGKQPHADRAARLAPRFGAPAPGSTAYAMLHPGPARRFALGVAGAASLFGMTAALAFAMNGAPTNAPQVNVTPPTQHMGVEDAKIIPDYPAPSPGPTNGLVDPPDAPISGSVPGVPASMQERAR